MIFSILGLLIGAVVLAAGLYYLIKEKADKESRAIYGVVSGIGAAVFIAMLVKLATIL